MTANISAVENPLTSKPEKNLSVIFITMANTISLTKKDRKKKVTRFKGKRSNAPIVAFKIPITKATSTAVPKLLIFTEGKTFDANNRITALIISCNIQFIFFVFLCKNCF